MERLRLVAAIWNWLPAFRVVAETQHLPTASRQLAVSPSALSRTIKVLEEQLGHPLFRRVGRRIELNDEGEQLLWAVRDAMRLVHDAMELTAGERFSGKVRVSSAGLITTTYLASALQRLHVRHPTLRAEVDTTLSAELPAKLLQGDLDIAFQSVPLAHPRLTTVHLGDEQNSVFCGPGHPLYGRTPSLDEVLLHAFAAPPADAHGRTFEGWPSHIPRTVAMTIGQMHVGVQICASGSMLAVLPDVVAERYPAPLHRIEVDVVPDTPLLAVHRPTLGRSGPAELLLAMVREEIAAK